ncbi:S9 family peptidase [Marinihelvus fidelis]|uniref:S9 family peptidase n=2 Tax=Marinihelvus fidelis TaxID=2613842 RepID=A0A5N0TGA5_9GAMM|nr:S9 family peptidase [Marinihelvus fidelis]
MDVRLNHGLIIVLLLCLPVTLMAQTTIEEFTRLPSSRDVKISPDGKHLSAVFRRDGEDLLGVLDRATREPIASFKVSGKGRAVGEVTWVNNERIVYTVTESYHWNKQRFSNGELVGVNVDGKKHRLIFGYRSGESTLNTRIQKNKANYGNQEIIDLLEDDEDHILIAFYPWRLVGNMWMHDPGAQTLIYKLNVYTGKTKKVDVLPYANARAITDSQGVVRFAVAVNDSNNIVISFKPSAKADWQEWQPEDLDAEDVTPLSFTADDQKIYMLANVEQSTQGLYLFDFQTKAFEQVVHDEDVDITMLIRDFSDHRVVGVGTDLGLPKYSYLDGNDKKVQLHRMLLKAFPGQDVVITSATEDGALAIAFVYSDTNSGHYYLFETESLQASYLLSKRKWLDPDAMAPTKAMTFETRDGETIHGYVTLPRGKGTNLPLVVLPHGGPHGVRDYWGFDWEVQLLASRGYGVLQVNFRGSGGFGLDFEKSGFGKWGTLMQDDITDATLALVESGVADASRICIYGHSYGGYAALMGAVREPQLYQCAIGSMGVYNLPMMFKEGDIPDRASGLAYLKQALGEDQADLQERSPAYNADRIEADILLIHGARDERAPIEQAESLKSALDDAGKSYQWLEIGDEAHGYYDEDNRLAVYEKVLTFLDANIGD